MKNLLVFLGILFLLACGGGGGATPTAVVTPPPIITTTLSYPNSSVTVTKGAMIAPLVPTVTGGPIILYAISPSLPTGLNLNSTTGVISGSPSIVLGTTDFLVTGQYTGGSTNAKVTFTVNEVIPPVVGPISVLMNQGIQMPDGSVPLVAGRTMFFQVFMNQPSVLGLPVRAELWNGSTLVTAVDSTLPSTMTTEPTNLKVLGTSVVNGYTYHVSVGSNLVTGTLAALAVPKIPITVVPLTIGSITGTINKNDLEKSFLRVFPVQDVLDIQYTDPMIVPGLPTDPLDGQINTALVYLDQKRIEAKDNHYYLGVWRISDAALLESNGNGNSLRGIGGLCSGKTSIIRSNSSMEVTFPHEFGHAFGLVDISVSPSSYPYPDFEVLGYGIDIVEMPGDTHLIASGKHYDFMAYKNPLWVSDFHFKYLINAIIKDIH